MIDQYYFSLVIDVTSALCKCDEVTALTNVTVVIFIQRNITVQVLLFYVVKVLKCYMDMLYGHESDVLNEDYTIRWWLQTKFKFKNIFQN